MTEDIRNELSAWRRQIIENEFSSLNNMQRRAVCTVTGPLLILAGAGSGKTTVLVNRIANLLRWGRAYETDAVYGEYSAQEIETVRMCADENKPLPDGLAARLSVSAPAPWRILAITFTNKAASELKDRICARVGEQGLDIWACTFHSACGRILRSYASLLGYSSHFTVYDGDDQKRIVKEITKQLNLDEKLFPPRSVLAEISNAKDNMMTPEDFADFADGDGRLTLISRIYKEYQQRLFRADAMDFDDMIFNTVVLLRNFAEVREKYTRQFEYVMVDEYQDTNHMQYELVRLLSGERRNICVVGDDDQSIYRFRGATIRNILEFEDDFDNAVVIKLEQNYRSTQTILSAANTVIKNNTARKDKTLWTANDTGAKLVRYNAADEHDESGFIVNTIQESIAAGGSYSDFAVLYRMNSQSQPIERALVRAAVPYRIIGGHRFYERREIRDMIAYLSLISNNSDDVRLRRIVNIPKRAIGDSTVNRIAEISGTLGQSMFETMKHADEFDALCRSRDKLYAFCGLIEDMAEMLSSGTSVSDMYETLVEKINYTDFIRRESDHGDEAVENIRELKSSIMRYEQENPDNATLQGFLEEVALLSDIDSYNTDDGESFVVLMTLHCAKGLEFNNVIIPGMEDNTFPSYQALMSEEQMQEERRLAYVGITRAKKRLYLICSRSRTLFGKTNHNRPSRFLSELPEELVEEKQRALPEVMINTREQQRQARRNDFASSHKIGGIPQKKASDINYTVGMRVIHRTFGPGMIIDARPMGNDTLLEIAFDNVGTKKIMANYANLQIE